MKGKGIFVWRLNVVPDLLTTLEEGNFQRVDLKVADNSRIYTANDQPELIKQIQEMDIEVYGYGFCYGVNPVGEGKVAAERVKTLGLDGYIFDIESRFERFETRIPKATALCHEYRTRSPDTPTAFCSWPLFHNPYGGGSWHHRDLAEEFMKFCDIAMPMCYWGYFGYTARAATAWLDWSIQQYRLITDKPIIPVGRAYVDSWENISLYADAVQAFGDRVRNLDLPGESWWELGWVTKNSPSVLQVLMNLSAWDLDNGESPDNPVYNIRRALEDEIVRFETAKQEIDFFIERLEKQIVKLKSLE